MESITNCSVGIFLRDTCHQTKYTRKQGLKSVFELETEARNLLQVRSDHVFPQMIIFVFIMNNCISINILTGS